MSMGVILVAGLSTFMCEEGLEHVDQVNFDQINNAGMEVVDIH